MNRLTTLNKFGSPMPIGWEGTAVMDECNAELVFNVVDRLSAYEDADLLPAEITAMRDEVERLNALVGELRHTLLGNHLKVYELNADLRNENARLARELEAAKGDFADYVHGGHEKCAHCAHDDECEPGESLCHGNVNSWEWRGVCPANAPSPGEGERGGGTDGKAD